MAYEPHIRMTAIGTLPGDEIFNFSLNLGREDPDGPALWTPFGGLQPNDAVWQDMADDLSTYWASSWVSSRATLRSVKFASIGADGKYAAAPIEKAIGGPSGTPGPTATNAHPNQVAMAVTLHTPADLGRVKGRYYLPMPAFAVETDGRVSEGNRDAMETAAQTFINNLNNQPGIDVLDIRVIVASQGRRNSDGSVKLPPGNHIVNAVSVGRTFDTVRRRRNKVTEMRGTASEVS